MARIMALDYGGKRTGIATTDPLQIIATPLTTVETKQLLTFLKDYCDKEEVEAIVIGKPTRHDGSDSAIEKYILEFIQKLKEVLPQLSISRINEMYTSKEAMQTLIASGVKKKKRRDKKLLDSTAATLILQEFLQHR